MNRFQHVDFVRVYKVLLLRAMGIVRQYGAPETFDGGLDYEDMVGVIFQEFFTSPDGLGWKESKGSIEAYLGRALHNKIVDHLRRQKHLGRSLDDEDHANAPVLKNRSGEKPERAKSDFTAQVYGLVGEDAALRDLIAAAEMTTGAHNVNQELGALLNKTPHQVAKLKERLLQQEGVKELYAARQAAQTRV